MFWSIKIICVFMAITLLGTEVVIRLCHNICVVNLIYFIHQLTSGNSLDGKILRALYFYMVSAHRNPTHFYHSTVASKFLF